MSISTAPGINRRWPSREAVLEAKGIFAMMIPKRANPLRASTTSILDLVVIGLNFMIVNFLFPAKLLGIQAIMKNFVVTDVHNTVFWTKRLLFEISRRFTGDLLKGEIHG